MFIDDDGASSADNTANSPLTCGSCSFPRAASHSLLIASGNRAEHAQTDMGYLVDSIRRRAQISTTVSTSWVIVCVVNLRISQPSRARRTSLSRSP